MTAAQAPGTTAARGSQEGRQPREAGSGGEGDRPAFQLRKCHLPRTELSGRNQTSARHASSAKTDGHVPLPGARTAIARACAYAVLYWTPHKSAQLCAFTRWPRFRLSRLQRSVGARMLSGLVIRALGASTRASCPRRVALAILFSPRDPRQLRSVDPVGVLGSLCPF